ncbi:MAG: GAF domain-containing protein [Phycisphaerales bacterium]
MLRDYAALSADLLRRLGTGEADLDARMRAVVDAGWDHLSTTGVSWIGFYTLSEDGSAMRLGPRRDKPACSPIGLHGACGRACTTRTTLVVTHVARLGEGYVACDPRDTSELVVPCIDELGTCWGVLDADSFDEGSFSRDDAAAVAALLEQARLTTAASSIPIEVI